MIFRTHQTSNFTVLPNAMLRDRRLSYKARGVLCCLLSQPGTWRASISELSGTSGEATLEGKYALQKALKELEALGYARLTRTRGAGGRLRGTSYDIYDTPQLADSSTDGQTGPQEAPEIGTACADPPRVEKTRPRVNPPVGHHEEERHTDSDSEERTDKTPPTPPGGALSGSTKREEEAKSLVALYSRLIKVSTIDGSHRQGRINAAKCLKDYSHETLERCVRRYAIWCERRGRDDPDMRKNVGNFFGRDAIFEQFVGTEWEPPPWKQDIAAEKDHSSRLPRLG